MANQKPGKDQAAGFGPDSQAMDALLRQEAAARLSARADDDAPQPPDDDLLFDYLSGRLDEEAEEAVRDWLIADPDVAQRLDDLQDFMATGVPDGVSEPQSEGSGDGPWQARLAWKDLQERLPGHRGSRAPMWAKPSWIGLAASILLMAGGGIGWWLGSRPNVDLPRGVQSITLQTLRDGPQSVPAGRDLALSMPLNLSQGSCDTLDWTLWRGEVPLRRLTLTPQNGQLHLYLPSLEPGDYRIDIEDCRGGLQTLELQAEPSQAQE